MAPKTHILFSSGEAIEDADFMRLQKMLRSQAWDYAGIEGGFTSIDFGQGSIDRQAVLWAAGVAGAPYPDVAAVKMLVNPGWIGQWISGINKPVDGGSYTSEEPSFVAYHVGPNELDTQHDVGSAGDRWDLVSVKIAPATYTDGDAETRHFEDAVTRAKSSVSVNKRQRLAITKTLTKGASGGGIPALPAGHVPLYLIKIPAAYNAAFAPSSSFPLRDHRMPLGTFHVDVHVCDMIDRGLFSAAWTKQGTGKAFRYATANNGGAGADVGFLPDVGNSHARLVGISFLLGTNNTLTQYSVVRFEAPDGDLAGATQLGILNTELRGNPTAPAHEFRGVRLDNAGEFGGAFGTIDNIPVWHNGRPNAHGQRPEFFAVGTDDIFTRVGLKVTTVNDTARVHLARFHFAGTP